LRADAVAARRAEAATCGAGHLVRVNLGMLPNDERLGRAVELAGGVARAGEHALAE
jgi:hypothetical protein